LSRKKNPEIDTTGGGFGGTLGDLLRARGLAPTGPAAPEPSPPPAADPGADLGASLATCSARITHSRRERGGKTVTLIDGLGGLGPALPDLLRDLRRALGCGGTLEAEQVVLQGDVRERARDFLVERGARAVRIG